MEIKTFIEKAIEGGWEIPVELLGKHKLRELGEAVSSPYFLEYLLPSVLLDPKSWEAVGKVSSWEVHECEGDGTGEGCGNGCYPTYRDKMHQMIDALIEGGNIESYLKTL